jgi:type II secretion system protein J
MTTRRVKTPVVSTAAMRRGGHMVATNRRGFTLLELIIACVMLAILVTASYIAISQTIRARDRSQSRSDAFTRAAAVADLIATDTATALRDADLTDCRIAIMRDGKPGLGQDGLLLFSHLARSVRPGANQAEGDEAEVQFRVQPGEKPGSMTLWRRTDPVIDDVPDGGGVATALIDGVKGVNIQANNGTDWLDDWDSDNDGLPHAVRISVTGTDDSTKEAIVVRRVIALDRVPLPSEMEAMNDAASAAADAAANATANAAANTNTNTNATGNSGGGRGGVNANQLQGGGGGRGGQVGGRGNQGGGNGGGNGGRPNPNGGGGPGGTPGTGGGGVPRGGGGPTGGGGAPRGGGGGGGARG